VCAVKIKIRIFSAVALRDCDCFLNGAVNTDGDKKSFGNASKKKKSAKSDKKKNGKTEKDDEDSDVLDDDATDGYDICSWEKCLRPKGELPQLAIWYKVM